MFRVYVLFRYFCACFRFVAFFVIGEPPDKLARPSLAAAVIDDFVFPNFVSTKTSLLGGGLCVFQGIFLLFASNNNSFFKMYFLNVVLPFLMFFKTFFIDI